MMGLHDKPWTHLLESTLQTKQALQIQKKFFIIRYTLELDLLSAGIFPLSYSNGLLWLHSPGGVMCLG